MSIQTRIQGPREATAPIGLKDGGHVILACSACQKPLVDIHVTRPDKKKPGTDEVFEWRLRAKCCYCDDYSFISVVCGLFHHGGWGVPNPENLDDPDDNIVLTSIVNILHETDSEGNPVMTYEVKQKR